MGIYRFEMLYELMYTHKVTEVYEVPGGNYQHTMIIQHVIYRNCQSTQTSPAPKTHEVHGAAVPGTSTGVSFGEGVVIAKGPVAASVAMAELDVAFINSCTDFAVK